MKWRKRRRAKAAAEAAAAARAAGAAERGGGNGNGNELPTFAVAAVSRKAARCVRLVFVVQGWRANLRSVAGTEANDILVPVPQMYAEHTVAVQIGGLGLQCEIL